MNRRLLGMPFFLFLLLSEIALELPAAASDTQWMATGSLGYGREAASAVTLLDGRIFVVGGNHYPNPPTGPNGAEIFDPTTKAWTYAASTPTAGLGQDALRMADGRVLVASGCGEYEFDNVVGDAAYDPNYDSWTALAPLNFQHINGTPVLLASGKVLMVGGTACTGDRSRTSSFTIRPRARGCPPARWRRRGWTTSRCG